MAETIQRENERDKVESWRLHVLMEAGYPLPLAEKLAASEADLHHAVELVGFEVVESTVKKHDTELRFTRLMAM